MSEDQSAAEKEDFDARIIAQLREGKKIGAIKLYREKTGEGLREAKDAVEEIARQNGIVAPAGGGCASVLAAILLAAALLVATTV